ncbi:Ribonuclease, partial [Trichinella britovi]
LYVIGARFACREKKINFKAEFLQSDWMKNIFTFASLQYWKRQQISRFTMRKIIQTSAAPKAIGPYSQAVLVDDRTLYISGQLGLCPSTMELIDGGADEQCKQALMNMGEILKAAGATYNDVVKTTIFLSDMRNWNTINDVYKEFFKENYPARSAFQVAALPKVVQMRTLKLKLLLWWDRTSETTLLGNNLG